ncbi:hemerythrin domain-containing protein [Rhodococcus sp. NPDC058521]|uniref:hemerythrin domain-containing protein n=1 Tax=Rhodococcus sp. NPDC058521 TaxID=3346536 RepID=UPI003646E30E
MTNTAVRAKGQWSADPFTMSMFHSALRRDLERAAILLADPSTLSVRRKRRLGRHLQWLMHALRWHHEGEDHYLWPLLLDREPESSAILATMEAEHEAIDGPLLEVEAVARGLVSGRTSEGDASAALTAFERPLRDHLAHEEVDGLAIVRRVLTHREWAEFEQKAWIDGYTVSESIRFVSWMLDGLQWSKDFRDRVGVPTTLYWAVVKPLSYVAHLPALSPWAGTRAARVASRIR